MDIEEDDNFVIEDGKDSPTWDDVDGDSESEDENLHSNFIASLDKTERVWTTDIHYVPEIHAFHESRLNPGFKLKLNENSTPADFFVELFDLQIVEKIAEETNKFAKLASRSLEECAAKIWRRDTDAAELYVFFALVMLMARKRSPTIGEYWSTAPILHQPFFSKIMPRDRFISILSRLTFNTKHDPNNILTKVQPFLDRIREVFKATLVPFQNLRIGESQSELTGHDVVESYVVSRKKKLSINVFVLHDVKNDFIVDLMAHVGSRTSIHESGGAGMSGAVVTTLMEDFFNKGYNLYTDRWYTSPQLFSFVHSKGTNACGTVLPGRLGMPIFRDLVGKHDSDYHCTEKMMAIKWKDNGETFHMLSTMHDASFIAIKKTDSKKNSGMKPIVSVDYEANKKTTSNNKIDVLIEQATCFKNYLKWHRKIGFHFVDLIFVNAHSAYKCVTGKKIQQSAFQLELITELVERFHSPTTSSSAPRKIKAEINPVRFSGQHYPCKIPNNPNVKKSNTYRNCHICLKTGGKRQATRYMCSDCDVSLCVIPCFKNYHESKIA